MVAAVMRISEDLKNFIKSTQKKLKREIQEHSAIYNKLKQDPENPELERKLKHIQNSINGIGRDQQFAVHRIKLEVKEYSKTVQSNGISHAAVGRTTNLNNALQSAANKLKKSPSASPDHQLPSATPAIEGSLETTVISDDSDTPSVHSPEPPTNPLNLDDLTQAQFLKYFSIVTHAVHDDMQKKRVERKRRSTANPQFFYGTKWDFPKRKRGGYLLSCISPPNTRQAAKNKAKVERPITPPCKDSSPRGVTPPSTSPNSTRPDAPLSGTTSPVNPSDLTIPKLPMGLTIERIDPQRSTPDAKLCIVCCLPGSCLSVCETCSNGFHVSCHNRPLVQQPKKCPKCIVDMEVHTVGSLNVPSGMTVSYVSSTELTEKLHEKQLLLEENKSLTAELIKLQDQHSQLTTSLQEQQLTQEELLNNQHSTEDKIKNLLNFINSMKSSSSL